MTFSPTDLLMVVFVGEASARYGTRLEKIGLQKSLFLTELEQHRRRLPSPSFRFYRWKRGPYSRELEEARIYLEKRGWVKSNSPQLTHAAEEVVRSILPITRQVDSATFESLWNSALAVSQLTADELGQRIYAMELTETDWPGGRRIRIEDIPQRDLIIDPDSLAGGTLEKALPPSVKQAFELMFSVRPEQLAEFQTIQGYSIDALDDLLKT